MIYQQVNFGAYQVTKDVFGGNFGFQFQSEQFLNNLKFKCEDTIFSELRQKINDFLSIIEGLQWRPKKPEGKPHEFVEDLV